MLFPEPEESTNSRFMSAGQVKMSLRDNDQVLVVFASLRVENDVAACDMAMVCEFFDVFPKDICDLPPECEVDFTIDLVPGTRPVSAAPYIMSPTKLGELKSQLEGLLEKKLSYQMYLLGELRCC